jgi:hypothetical protein
MTGITERFYFLCGDAMGQNKSSNVVWHHATVTRERHEALNGHGSVLWFPGLSGCREIYHAGDSLTLFLQQLGSYELTRGEVHLNSVWWRRKMPMFIRDWTPLIVDIASCAHRSYVVTHRPD